MSIRHLTCLAFPLILLAACSEPVEPPPEPLNAIAAPQAGVDASCRWTIADAEAENGAQQVRIEPDPGMGPAEVVWRGGLDSDAAEDLLVRFPEACGNYGDCPHALYVACTGGEGGRYREVWAPDYALEIKFGEPGSDGWREVLRVQREGDRVTEAAIELKKAPAVGRPE